MFDEKGGAEGFGEVALEGGLRERGWEVFGGRAHGGVGIGKLIGVGVERVTLRVGGWHLHRTVELVRVLLETRW